MNKVLMGLAAIPLLSGVASAAQPLTDGQMDAVTAGFNALSTAEAQALGKIVATQAATASLVAVVTTRGENGNVVPVTATFGETTLTLIKAVSAAASVSTATNALPTAPIGLSTP